MICARVLARSAYSQSARDRQLWRVKRGDPDVAVLTIASALDRHLWDEPPDGPPVGHGSTLASCMRGRTSTPQYLAAGLRAAISKARSRLSQSTIVKLPRYSLASA